MKIAEINMTSNGSTGKIMFQVARVSREAGHDVKTYTPVRYARGKKLPVDSFLNHFTWGSRAGAFLHYYVGTLFGKNGSFSIAGTKQLIKNLKTFEPDIIHLHNLHKYCINFSMLFDYIKKSKVKAIWTLHDCWTFTGHCAHFTMVGCEKWKDGCHHCPQPKAYPKMYVDTSKKMYELKKKWFCGVENMTIVTPSHWLKNLVEQSFLNQYPVKVINNGIDLSVFKPCESSFREKYALDDKKVVLGVAFDWGYKKGLDVMIELSKRLPDDYRIVLVGTNDLIDSQLPDNIISIHRTENQTELAEIYTAADVFVNPTREEVFGLVNAEALACGTPVITYATGGSPEVVDETCGKVVGVNDIESLYKEIILACEQKLYSREACVKRSHRFDMNDRFEEYVALYNEVIKQ